MRAESQAAAACSMASEERSSTATSPARTRRGKAHPDMAETPGEPHAVSVIAWDIPTAVVVGEKFRMKVGIKCAHECDLANVDFGVFDEKETQVATGTLPAERWPGTTGLHVAEVDLEAPSAEGLHTWSVKSASRTDGEVTH